MKIIDNHDRIASGKIYNIGNPKNNLSIGELARLMVRTALSYPEYRGRARKVRLRVTKSEKYYGKGYQDMQHRVPQIDKTRRDLDWRPRVAMRDAIAHIFDAYRGHIAEARRLVS